LSGPIQECPLSEELEAAALVTSAVIASNLLSPRDRNIARSIKGLSKIHNVKVFIGTGMTH
jgi:hypothetical protein